MPPAHNSCILDILTHFREALKQVIECAPHPPGHMAKFLSRMLQRNHPPSLPAPECEGFSRLPIRLFTYHDELLSMVVFHDEPRYIHHSPSCSLHMFVSDTVAPYVVH